MPTSPIKLTESEIHSRLARVCCAETENPFPPGFLADTLRNAAVLIPLLHIENDWHVLFIRRTANAQDPHSGQVAFPGGAADNGDPDAEATALREAYEEIGLNQKDVRILGRLHDFVTVTSYIVTPVVGVIPWPYTFQLAQNEVSRTFTIPLDWLASPENSEDKIRHLPEPYTPIEVIYYKPYDSELLWGVSARFTRVLVSALYS
jgi:8-oxo-dGTP pyrophosphatase MutT (NUDIX family)